MKTFKICSIDYLPPAYVNRSCPIEIVAAPFSKLPQFGYFNLHISHRPTVRWSTKPVPLNCRGAGERKKRPTMLGSIVNIRNAEIALEVLSGTVVGHVHEKWINVVRGLFTIIGPISRLERLYVGSARYSGQWHRFPDPPYKSKRNERFVNENVNSKKFYCGIEGNKHIPSIMQNFRICSVFRIIYIQGAWLRLTSNIFGSCFNAGSLRVIRATF